MHFIKLLSNITGVEITTKRPVPPTCYQELMARGIYYNSYLFNEKYGQQIKDIIFLNIWILNGSPDIIETTCVKVLFHELAHFTGNKDKLNRPSLHNYTQVDNRNIEETIAESVAFKLMRHYKFNTEETDKESLEYLQDYFTIQNVNKEIDEAFEMIRNWTDKVIFFPEKYEQDIKEKYLEFMKAV